MIENFKETDINEVIEIWLNSNIDAHSFIDESYWKNNYDYVKEILPNADIYVFRENNVIKGFLGINNFHIEGIFVDKKYRNFGIGKLLLSKAKELKDTLTLNVYEKNMSAVNFYKNNGFTVVEKKLEEDFGEMEYLMEWKG
ncbi:GNAT family N-acetyltransferase [Fusobacterium sp. PH5-44]|uniref:GNAT family N-acetyltransferase n=1 Tax=unclassified Fusobacterium TaxID=2648384 RepID=UPI003D22296E